MGLVVSFVPRVAATHRSPAAGQAAIIIFPGVRYERVPDLDDHHEDSVAALSVPAPKSPH